MKRAVAVLILVTGLYLQPQSSEAAEFMDVKITDLTLEYVVLRDLNVRIKPDTKSKRIDGLKKGSTIQSPGRHQGWVAVLSEEGNPLGFAYKKFLLPILDGELTGPVEGIASISGGGQCAYTIEFKGKSEANAVLFKMADYETELQCTYGGEDVLARIFMFMTEGPMTRSRPSAHQIGMDLLEIESEDAYDEIFSTNVIYDHDKQLISFDGVTLKGFADKPAESEQSVASVPEALSGAVRMALESWNEKTWKTLAEATE